MVAITAACLLLAIFVDTIYGIFILSADIMFVTVFPQLFCAIYIPFANPYGSFVGYMASVILRFGGGEPTLSIDPFIEYPNYDEEMGQLFPFRTFAMLSCIFCVVTVSWITNYLFKSGRLPQHWDISRKVVWIEEEESFAGPDLQGELDNTGFELDEELSSKTSNVVTYQS